MYKGASCIIICTIVLNIEQNIEQKPRPKPRSTKHQEQRAPSVEGSIMYHHMYHCIEQKPKEKNPKASSKTQEHQTRGAASANCRRERALSDHSAAAAGVERGSRARALCFKRKLLNAISCELSEYRKLWSLQIWWIQSESELLLARRWMLT